MISRFLVTREEYDRVVTENGLAGALGYAEGAQEASPSPGRSRQCRSRDGEGICQGDRQMTSKAERRRTRSGKRRTVPTEVRRYWRVLDALIEQYRLGHVGVTWPEARDRVQKEAYAEYCRGADYPGGHMHPRAREAFPHEAKSK